MNCVQEMSALKYISCTHTIVPPLSLNKKRGCFLFILFRACPPAAGDIFVSGFDFILRAAGTHDIS